MDVVIENEPRLQILLELISEDATISARELAQNIQVAERTVQRDIEVLKIAGKIKRVGGNRYGRWEIQVKSDES